MKVVWTERAKHELRGINGYLEYAPTAKQLIKAIRRRVQMLSQFPLMGRMIPEINDPALRELIVGQFRVLHHVYPDRIDILRVVDGHRLFDPFGVSESVTEYELDEPQGAAAKEAAEAFRRWIVIQEIQAGIREADAGLLIPDEELDEYLAARAR